MSWKVCLAILALVLAYFYSEWSSEYETINRTVINSWTKSVILPHKRFLKILAGINACIDIIVPATQLLEKLNVRADIAADHPELSTFDSLQETFKHFFQKGAAAERKFTDSLLFRNLTDTALQLAQAQQYIGGNAALIAQNMVTSFQDVQVNFIGPVGPQLRSLLHPRILVKSSSFQSSDEHHLILEYQVGEKWGNVTAPIATRFITSFDETNSRMIYVETYFDELVSFAPDLAILTGFHMLDGLESSFYKQRLQLVAEKLSKLPLSLPLHVELASIFNRNLIETIGETILARTASLGLNEQELQQLSALLGGPHTSLLESADSIQPELYRVVDVLVWLLHRYGHANGRLSRIHFHCLTFHVVAVLKGSGWSHTEAAVAAGTAKASKHACDTETLNPRMLEIRLPPQIRLYANGPEIQFNPDSPVTVFELFDCEIAFSPVLVCKHPLKTVGLGDAISATGLLYSQFSLPSSNTV